MSKIVHQICKLDERLEGKPLRHRRRTTRCCWIPISPLATNSDAAPCWLAQDQRLGRADTPGFEDGETLPSKGMKGVAHFSPSQRLIGTLGSSH
jgi:hypothetical protein